MKYMGSWRSPIYNDKCYTRTGQNNYRLINLIDKKSHCHGYKWNTQNKKYHPFDLLGK